MVRSFLDPSGVMVRSLLDPSRVMVRSLLDVFRALIEVCSRRRRISTRKSSPEETPRTSSACVWNSDVSDSVFMVLEDFLVDCIWGMLVLLEDGAGRG